MNEWDLIDKIKKSTDRDHGPAGSLLTGIGDDCAVFSIGGGLRGLITTDISIEGVHFDLRFSSPSDIGYKAMISNISDIAAMGGKALYAFISLGIPPHLDETCVLSLYKGFDEACSGLGMSIAGGDLSRAAELVINIAIYGEAASPLLRAGAKPGDTVYVTGTLGDSKAGLETIYNNDSDKKTYPVLVKKHLRPERRIDFIPGILKNYHPSAMIDISDGLLSDLRHICAASNTGFLLDAESIPRSEELQQFCRDKGLDTLDFALKSGEEYELLFTSAHAPGAIEAAENGIAVTSIGTITDSDYRIKKHERTEEIRIEGFEHFSNRGS